MTADIWEDIEPQFGKDLHTGTFIERYGHVKYTKGWSVKKYQVTGPCEVPGCTEYRAEITRIRDEREREGVRRSKADILEAREIFWESFEMALYTPPDNIVGRIMMNNQEAMLRATTEQHNRDRQVKASNPFVLDHCHDHGFIRGIVCRSCNNSPLLCGSAVSHERNQVRGEPDYWAHLAKCPECAIDLSRVKLTKPRPVNDYIAAEPGQVWRWSTQLPDEWHDQKWEIYRIEGQLNIVSSTATSHDEARTIAGKLTDMYPTKEYRIRKKRRLKPEVTGKIEALWQTVYGYRYANQSDADNPTSTYLANIYDRLGITPNPSLPQDDGLREVILDAERTRFYQSKKQ